jgi:hypothetical protein
VSVFPRDGKTTIRVSERFGRLAAALFGPIMGGWGGGTGGIWMGLGVSMGHPGFGGLLWGANVVAAYLTARGIFQRQSRKRYETGRALAEALGAQARVSVDAAQKKLPRAR